MSLIEDAFYKFGQLFNNITIRPYRQNIRDDNHPRPYNPYLSKTEKPPCGLGMVRDSFEVSLMRPQCTVMVETVTLVDQENYPAIDLGGDGAASCLLHAFDAKTRVNIFENLLRSLSKIITNQSALQTLDGRVGDDRPGNPRIEEANQVPLP
jgi:hypothetical protein